FWKQIVSTVALLGPVYASPSALEVVQDMFNTCIKDFSVGCVKPKAMSWVSNVINQPVIKITEDLLVVKKSNPSLEEEERSNPADIFDKFEDFLQSHDVVAKVPEILRPTGPLAELLPRSFQPTDLSVPMAATGRSKMVKKILVPFLLGLKFKTAVLVPLALALIALKTWKALTLGLLSLVLTGALVIFRLTKPKVTTYEVVHYPQHEHVHHIEAAAAPTGWEQPVYGRSLNPQEMAYSAYVKQ
ncbi:uncharacterized protein LOC108734494, partial [Agrilus planipennis]|uniref:Uncharacterized protein LOC108734494 n=1 Tax=Agrilus planipennis TaxID=224129 RepID=A0A7F5RK86_AGRPL